jgi:hypothetical protein
MRSVIVFINNVYQMNKNRALNFRRGDPNIYRFGMEVMNNFPPHHPIYQYASMLLNHNRRKNVYFKPNDMFVKEIYNLSLEFIENKPEPLVSLEDVKLPEFDKKAALLIGINYKGTDAELRGCENDIMNTKKVLIEKYGFEEKDIIVLMESLNIEKQPTRQNILKYIRWLVNKSNSGYGKVWFQYSGHGVSINDRNGDEKDGKDECIYTCDDKLIVDDEFHKELVSRMHKESKLFCFMDCCHSGSIMDLKYKYRAGQNQSLCENSKKAAATNVLALSGCKDDQTSADAWLSGDWCGALTKTFLDVMKQSNYDITLFDMVNKIRNGLQKGGFTQIPQLTSSKDVSTDTKFSI